jgi:hypothetical protein
MRPHIKCPRGSHKNRAGQCISTTPRRRVIRDVLPSPPSPPSPNFSSPDTPIDISPMSPFINMNPDKNEGILYNVKEELPRPDDTKGQTRKCPRGSKRDRRTGQCRTTTPRRRIVEEPPARVTQRRARLPRAAHNPAPAPAPPSRRKRCPPGYRRNPITGECEQNVRQMRGLARALVPEIEKSPPSRRQRRAQAPPAPAPAPPAPAPAPAPAPNRPRGFFLRPVNGPAPANIRRPRCPPGTMRNSNGDCVPKRMSRQRQAIVQQQLIHREETPYNTDGVIEAYDAYMAGDSPINDPDVLNDPNVIVFYITNANGIVINAVLGYRDRINTEYVEKTSHIYKCKNADTAFAFFPNQVLMADPYFSLGLVQNHVIQLQYIEYILRSDNKFWLLRLSPEPPITSAINRKHIRQNANPDYNIDGNKVSVVSGYHCQVNNEYLKLHENLEKPKRIIADPIHGDQLIYIWVPTAITPSAI